MLAGNRINPLADKDIANRVRINCIWGTEEEEVVVVVMGEAAVEVAMRAAVDKVAGGSSTI